MRIDFTLPKCEADVYPRPLGDGAVIDIDRSMVGRFAAKLAAPLSGDEFQRIDCAPRAKLGDGAITVADWVQAGRYAAGLDPLTPTGGPSTPQPYAGKAINGLILPLFWRLLSTPPTVELSSTLIFRGQTGTVSVTLNARGNESAVGFSVRFDPQRLAFVDARLTGGVGAVLYANTAQAAAGRVGFALMRPLPRPFSAGRRTILLLTFRALASAPNGMTTLAFDDQPVMREVASLQAAPVVTTFYGGMILIIDAIK